MEMALLGNGAGMITPHLASMAKMTRSLLPITETYGTTQCKPCWVGLLCPEYAMSLRYLGIDIGNSHTHPPFMASLRGVIESAFLLHEAAKALIYDRCV